MTSISLVLEVAILDFTSSGVMGPGMSSRQRRTASAKSECREGNGRVVGAKAVLLKTAAASS
jgi:hypothetical protein